MSFSSQVKEEIEKIKLWDNNTNMKQEEQIRRLCIRQAFLECGSINDPNKKYHLELVFKKENKAKEIQEMLFESSINAKIGIKGKNYIVYLKDGEEISKFLALIGANTSVIRFEETRVIKETRNNINRLVNCENANMDKIIGAAVIQIDAINYLEKSGKINDLPEALKEIAIIRKKNPHLSLIELGKKMKDPIGKSGVNHRLKKIIEIADSYKEMEDN